MIIDKLFLIYCLWLMVDKGYKVNYFLKYWEKLRGLCYYIVLGDVCENFINFLIYLIDLVGFLLLVVNKLMSLIKEEV